MRRIGSTAGPGLAVALLLGWGSVLGPVQAQQPISGGTGAGAAAPAAVARPVVRQVPAPGVAVGTPAVPVATTPASAAVASVPPPASAPAPVTAAAPPPLPTVTAGQRRSPAPAPLASGNDTRRLLDLQAGGLAAAPGQPMLGVTSHLAWQRYLETYTLEVPQWFETHIERNR